MKRLSRMKRRETRGEGEKLNRRKTTKVERIKLSGNERRRREEDEERERGREGG